MSLSILALSLISMPFADAPHSASAMPSAAYSATVACHPDPSKNRGCFRESKQAEHKAPAATQADATMVHCHPDPSKNRGCLRPSPHSRANPSASFADAGETQ